MALVLVWDTDSLALFQKSELIWRNTCALCSVDVLDFSVLLQDSQYTALSHGIHVLEWLSFRRVKAIFRHGNVKPEIHVFIPLLNIR